MTITNPMAAVPDSGPWIHNAFMIRLGDEFTSYVEGLKYAHADQLYNQDGSSVEAVPPKAVLEILNDMGPEDSGKMTPLYYAKHKVRDTSLGGNPVINPLPQYNETDDPPTEFTKRADGSLGMGRVYSSEIDDQQNALYLQFGTPIFNTLAAFYTFAVDPDMATINDKGVTYSNFFKIGRLFSYPFSLAVKMPTLALESLYRFASYEDAPITSYYDFKNEQLLYYRYVNTILVILSANMGWMEPAASSTRRDEQNTRDRKDQEAEYIRDQKIDIAEHSGNVAVGTPEYISQLQMDIGRILYKRWKMLYGSQVVKDKSTDEHIQELLAYIGTKDIDRDNQGYNSSGSTSATDNSSGFVGGLMTWVRHFFDGVKAGSDLGTYMMAQYIGFRLDSSFSISESLRNSTGKPNIDGAINSRVKSIREKVFASMGGALVNLPVIGGVMKGAYDAASGIVGGILSNTGLGGLTQLATGSALVDIPHVWEDSEFNRSYSFEFHLRAIGGDDLSIMQDVYVPFACLLAGAFPRAQGPASYTSPFLCKAFAKGMVSIPMGMITSMSITRGAAQHGWSKSMKPTEIKVSIDITDMSPSMFVSMGSTGALQDIRDRVLGTNTNFMGYLEMLSGLDIHSKLGWQGFLKRLKVYLAEGNQDLNPELTGMTFSELPFMRVLGNIVPTSWTKPS